MEQKPPLRLRGLQRTEVLGVRVPVATGLRSRLLGLAMLRRPRAGTGLLLPRCRSIHTFGMWFDLDVHFIDDCGREIRRVAAVPPGRVLSERRAAGVLEVPSRVAEAAELASEGGESVPPVT